VQQELAALLAVQADDLEIHGLEEQLAALQPRLKELDQRKARIAADMDRAQVIVTAEEKKQAFLREKITEHKGLIDRNQAQMDAVKTMRQATAAVAQMEEAKRIVATEESELVAINRRLEEARATLHAHQAALEACTTEQAEARSEVAAQQASLEGELAAIRAKREGKAAHVAAPLLSKYDRIRLRRRAQAAWPVNGAACGACDTAIPMQRRNQMSNLGGIDVCEACGVLMYFSE
jgi:predicted  nucleic acid-binding Zn-ribbon protein